MVAFEVPEIDYTRYTNRQLVTVPLAVLAVALLVIAGWYVAFGAPANPGLDFTGGTELRVAPPSGTNQAQARQEIQTMFPVQPDQVRYVTGGDLFVVTFQSNKLQANDIQSGALERAARDNGFTVQSVDSVSANFGKDTQTLAVGGVVVAFLGMSLLVFGMFRTFVPSIAVVLSAFSDIVIPVAVMNVLGIEMTLGTVAALLMLIGYSVDSDILLNNHVLRRSGGFYESTYRAMRTGVTMTLTSIAAMTVMAIVATVFGIGLLADIGLVLVIGLTADLMNTYMLNLSLLRWYKYEGVAR
ncbi:MAG: protein translocase subunit SecF [Haloferacaceae archaeon]